jgi:hypothetical protein
VNDQIWEIRGHFFAQSLNSSLNFEWEFWLGCGVQLPHESMNTWVAIACFKYEIKTCIPTKNLGLK